MPGTQGTQGAEHRRQAARREEVAGEWLHDGEYKVEAVLGQGGMGQVFLASHTMLQMPFALKRGQLDQPVPAAVIAELDRILHGDTLQYHNPEHAFTEQDFPLSGGLHTDRFIREALLLARLEHPSIPAIYDYFLEDGYWYLVMDYLPGPTLSAYIQSYAPLPALEALNYAMQLCDVLDYLHSQSPPVVFRDLKPSNVILSPDGQLMLVDFGIARYYKAGQMNDTTEFGSPGYASPEQYQGGGQTDGRSDLYSLGVMLHEMLSGKRPSGVGEKLESLHYMNPSISHVLSGLVMVATRAEPMYRFQSAHTLYRALERAYAIEERRAYQQRVLKATVEGDMDGSGWSSVRTMVSPLEEKIHAPLASTIQLSQRKQVREALQEAHHERLEQERAEVHLASIDESLKQRSSMGFKQVSLPAIQDNGEDLDEHPTGELDDQSDAEEMDFIVRERRLPRHAIKLVFILALVVLIIIASLGYLGLFSSHTQRGIVPKPSTPAQTQVPVTPTRVTAQQPGSWQVLPSLPSPEADNTALYVIVQGRAYIYMSGGFRGSHAVPTYDRTLYRYDIAAAHWEIVDSNFPGMGNNAATLDEQNHLYFTVGFSPELYAVDSLLYMYQPNTNTLQQIVPPSQMPVGFGASMFADQHGHLYITQGFMAAGNPHGLAGRGWYRYDIASGQWHLLAPLPVQLGYVLLTSDNAGNILLLGGSMDAGQQLPSKQIFRYDVAQNKWTTEQATSPAVLSGAASCMNGPGQLVVVGGYDPVHTSSLDQAWLLDLHTMRWTRLAPVPGGGSLLGTAACDGSGHVFLTRGANDPSSPTADFLELTIR